MISEKTCIRQGFGVFSKYSYFEDTSGPCRMQLFFEIIPGSFSNIPNRPSGTFHYVSSRFTTFQGHDSFLIKGKKVIKSLKTENNIAKLQRILETYKSTFKLYFSQLTVMGSPGQILPAVRAESKFYEIPAIRVNHFVGRKYFLDRIHKFFKEGASVVVLIGMGGKASRTELEPIQSCN